MVAADPFFYMFFHVSYLLRRLSPPLPKHRTQTLPAPVRKWSEVPESLWLQHFPIQQALTSPRGNLIVCVPSAKWSRVIDLLQGHDRGFYNVYLMWKRQTTNVLFFTVLRVNYLMLQRYRSNLLNWRTAFRFFHHCQWWKISF